jgi:predicted metal-dependent HD superfamily phosphohydrolase
MYPDFLYKPGRRKVLTHFLEMERIFKSDHFYQKYEEQARKNLLFESIALS